MKFIIFITNLVYRLGISLPAWIIFLTEKFLWKHPEKIKIFLSFIDPGALWRTAETKLVFLVNRFLKTTPALQDIKKQHFPNQKIKSVEDFKRLFPILDKNSYRKKYTLEDLNQYGKLPHAGGFYKSAGTSGNSTLWTESIAEQLMFEKTASFMADVMLNMLKRNYIILNCWAFSSWPTGINFAAAARFLGKVLNVGTNLKEAVDAITSFGPKYHYLLAGYPPFIYHVLEALEEKGLDLKEYDINIVSGGEGFVEAWRDSLIKWLGNKKTIFSVYGSTDKGLSEGLETNLAYIIRSLLYAAETMLTDEIQAKEILCERFEVNIFPFTQDSAKEFLLSFLKREENLKRLPMVFQFNPTVFYNENFLFMDPKHNREVNEFITTILSSVVSIPRVRYNIHDEGFVMHFEEVKEILKKHQIRLQDYNIRNDQYLELHLPFLFIFGRSDGTVSVDGANIFPEDVEECLYAHEELLEKTHTFQLFISKNYHLGIAFELKEGIPTDGNLEEKYRDHFTANLKNFSFGYNELVEDKLPSADLVVEIYPFSEGPFREKSLKMRYVKS